MTAKHRVTLFRAVAVIAAVSALAIALRYQLGVEAFGLDRTASGSSASERELLFTLFPLLLCVGMLVWGFFQKREAFVATMVGSLAFAGFTAFATYYVQRGRDPMRFIAFPIMVTPGQVVIVALTFGSALFAVWWANPPTRPKARRGRHDHSSSAVDRSA